MGSHHYSLTQKDKELLVTYGAIHAVGVVWPNVEEAATTSATFQCPAGASHCLNIFRSQTFREPMMQSLVVGLSSTEQGEEGYRLDVEEQMETI